MNIEDFPLEILANISNFLTDNEFILLTTVDIFFYGLKKINKLKNSYDFKVIRTIIDEYLFIHLIVDSTESIDILSKYNINTITLSDNFNGEIKMLYSLPNLNKINVSLNYTDVDSITSIPDNIVNKKQIILSVISNKIAFRKYSKSLEYLKRKDISKHPYPQIYNWESIYKIINKYFRTVFTALDKDFDCFTYKESYELVKLILSFTDSKYNNVTDFFTKFEILHKYQVLMFHLELKNCITKKNYNLPNFIKENSMIVKEFIYDIKFIHDHEFLCLKKTYEKIIKRYGFDSVNEYKKFLVELNTHK
ncbi:hypothetical protein QJ850_gp889 [Acanthamoeba polyphaga mimivirus]|uniref:F-box domain-containing protein n=1 Tax=Acanthamoeba polyphaga mimivirus Kroon TaxID=3069720 RepID=A0A0G2Y246_9VIRU|nr:hypothetical protein QJ850_gp889 [Acanthamoeba polyphaga mimivirus]AKI79810.1 hypothetical protein [Acanthamoeba polyphaga mimivirus Kroon]